MKVKALAAALSAILIAQLAGCGVILHPERQGQKSGQLDPAIVLLDAAGLVLFIVPGLVAFGVDFYYGTIYLPNTTLNLDKDDLDRLKQPDESANLELLAGIVSDEVGQKIDAEDIFAYRANSVEELNLLVGEGAKNN